VQVSYRDNTSKTIGWDANKLTADPAQGTVLTVTGHSGKTVTVSYGGKTAKTDALTVGKAEQAALSITGKPTTVYNGDTFTLTTTGGSGTGTVTWEIISGPATVDANGKVTVTGIGEIQIKAVKAADTEYAQSETTIALTAVKKPSSGGGSSSSGGSSGGGSSSGSGSSSDNGNSSGSTVVERPDQTKPEIPTTSQTKPVKPDKNGNTSIDGNAVQDAINKATALQGIQCKSERGQAVCSNLKLAYLRRHQLVQRLCLDGDGKILASAAFWMGTLRQCRWRWFQFFSRQRWPCDCVCTALPSCWYFRFNRFHRS